MEIKIYTGDDNAFEYDKYKFLESVVYFLKAKLRNLKGLDNINIYIEVDGPNNKESGKSGCIFGIDTNTAMMLISTNQIKGLIEKKLYFKNEIKSLLHCFVHETYHIIEFLEKYLQSETNLNLSDYWDKENDKERLIKEKLEFENKDKNKIEIWNMLPWEQQADLFAFENLSFMENLYYYEGILAISEDIAGT